MVAESEALRRNGSGSLGSCRHFDEYVLAALGEALVQDSVEINESTVLIERRHRLLEYLIGYPRSTNAHPDREREAAIGQHGIAGVG